MGCTKSKRCVNIICSSQNIKWRDTTAFVPPISGGRVIKVYDGDTITIANYMPYANSPLYRFSVRINGIDCPEIKTRKAVRHNCSRHLIEQNFK